MFGSTNPFGQSSTSPCGSQLSVFGQTNTISNPFAPKPFGSAAPFGSQTGSSIFGGMSTGVSGAAQFSSPFSMTLGASSSSPAFGSSVPAFGLFSTPAFGSSSSSFVGPSVFGQKPVFELFGSTPTQTSLFGSATQPSQPAFTSTPAFGVMSAPAFEATSTPAFGSTSSPTFGSTGSVFGMPSAPAFGGGGTFAASSTPLFVSSSMSAFGTSGTSFVASTAPAFGSSVTPFFRFGIPTHAFDQYTSAFGGSSPFGSTASPFGIQSSPFGSQTPTSNFGSNAIGQSGFGGQRAGSRVANYTPTTEVDGGTSGQTAKLKSISAMSIYKDKSHEELRWEDYQLGDNGSQTPTSTFGSTAIVQSGFGGLRGGSRVAIYTPITEVDDGTSGQTSKLESISAIPIYKDKSHEELRWEDYQLGDKGGPVPSAQSTGLVGFSSSTTQTFTFAPSPVFGQSSANLFSTSTPSNSNPFTPKTSTLTSGFETSAASAFNSSAFVSSTSAAAPSIFGSSTSPFGANSSPSPGFGPSTSLVNSASAQGTSSPFGPSLFSNTKSSQYSFGAPTTAQPSSSLGKTTSSFNQSSLFNSPSGLVGSIFSTSSSFTSSNLTGFGQTALQPSISTPFQPAQAAQTSATCAFSNFGQTQPVGASSCHGAPSIFSKSNFGLPASTQSSAVVQPAPIINPFGTLPALPQMSIGRVGTAPSIQYGISSMPVLDKPTFSISSLLTSRHLSPRQILRVTTKFHSKNDGPKFPFFRDDEDTPITPKVENLRVLITLEQWPAKACSGKALALEDRYTPVNENETTAENGIVKVQVQPITAEQTSNGINEDRSLQKGDMYMTLGGQRAGEAAIMYEHGADIEAVMPKLRHSDYYTLPRIQELAAKERAEPGFCRHVKDFMVGRQGYGSIKFLGETDVRQLDLESLIKFNNREVIVYMDESKKPPVGQGLNKPAEVTLLNVKCIDKKTGHQYTEGPKVEKYKELLKRRAEEQGTEFISYDPTKGEWKIKVNHFSGYKLVDEYSWDAC